MKNLVGLTFLVMVAFAANSILVRLALANESIGPLAFGAIRLLAGAVTLLLLSGPVRAWNNSSWLAAGYLLTYVLFFSFAYLSLDAGTGALILFAIVQKVMIGAGIRSGERLSIIQWLGTAIACLGLVFLLLPGSVGAPDPIGAIMMSLAGLGWALFSLKGKTVENPLVAIAGSFAKATLLIVAVGAPLLFVRNEAGPQINGILLAVVSGAITSGLGYALWYQVLRFLPASRAGIAQLSVPAIAAIGGLIFLGEMLSIRVAVTTAMVLGGVGLATLTKQQ